MDAGFLAVSSGPMQRPDASTDQLVGSVPLGPDQRVPRALDGAFDQSLVAVSFEGGTNQAQTSIEVWDLVGRQRQSRLLPEVGVVYQLAFSREARFLACTGDNGLIAYETSGFKTVTRYFGYLSARAAWAGEGTTLAIPLSQQNEVRLLEVTSETELARLTTPGEVKDVRASLNGSVLVAVDFTGPVVVVHLANTRERLRLSGHNGGVPAVEFSPDGKRVVSTGKDETIRFWDSTTGKLLQVLGNQHAEGQTVCFSPDGLWLASGNYRNHQILLWSVADGQRALVLGDDPPGGGGTWSCVFSPDSRILVAGGDGLRAWELVPRGATGPPLEARRLFSDPGYSRNLQIHPTGKWIAFEGTLRRNGQDVSGSFLRGLDPPNEPELADRYTWAVQTLGFADGGRTLLSRDPQRTLHFWDLQSHRIVRKLTTLTTGESGSTYVGNFRVSPDGSKVAVANHNGLGVNIYDLASGQRLYSLPDESASIWWLAWAPDNRRLAVARGNGDISLWNLTEVEAVLAKAGLAP